MQGPFSDLNHSVELVDAEFYNLSYTSMRDHAKVPLITTSLGRMAIDNREGTPKILTETGFSINVKRGQEFVLLYSEGA